MKGACLVDLYTNQQGREHDNRARAMERTPLLQDPQQPPSYFQQPPQPYPPEAHPPEAYPPQAYPPEAYPPQAYPPETYPPETYPPVAYPPQAYPPEAYPPQAYPPQAYQQQPPYPKQEAPLQNYPPQEAPPAYYHQPPPPQGQYQSTNVVVVQQQPQLATTIVQPYYRDYASGAIVFSVVVTVFALVCGCWWSLVCTVAAIAIAANAQSAAQRGDVETAKQNQAASIACSIFGVVSGIVPVIALIIWIAILVNQY